MTLRIETLFTFIINFTQKLDILNFLFVVYVAHEILYIKFQMLYQHSMAVTQLAVQESRVFHDLYCVGNFVLAERKAQLLCSHRVLSAAEKMAKNKSNWLV